MKHAGALLALTLAAPAAESAFRSLAVGPSPESVVRGFGGKLCVTLMGVSRQPGDGDGQIVMVDGDKVTVLADGLDDPKGIVLAGGLLITTDFTKVWAVDAAGKKRLLAGPEAFPTPPLFLNDVVVAPDGESVLVTDMGAVSRIFSGPGQMWPVDSEQGRQAPALGRVYRITLGGQISVVIDHSPEMPNPNGVDVLADGTIRVGEFFLGNLMEWRHGAWRKISGDHRGADGIVHDDQGHAYVSEVFSGRVWRVTAATGERELLATLPSAADHLLDPVTHELIVPDTKSGRLVFIPVPR